MLKINFYKFSEIQRLKWDKTRTEKIYTSQTPSKHPGVFPTVENQTILAHDWRNPQIFISGEKMLTKLTPFWKIKRGLENCKTPSAWIAHNTRSSGLVSLRTVLPFTKAIVSQGHKATQSTEGVLRTLKNNWPIPENQSQITTTEGKPRIQLRKAAFEGVYGSGRRMKHPVGFSSNATYWCGSLHPDCHTARTKAKAKENTQADSVDIGYCRYCGSGCFTVVE